MASKNRRNKKDQKQQQRQQQQQSMITLLHIVKLETIIQVAIFFIFPFPLL
jgi:hypothetical protein